MGSLRQREAEKRHGTLWTSCEELNMSFPEKNVLITQRMAKNVIPLIYSPWIENGKRHTIDLQLIFHPAQTFFVFSPFSLLKDHWPLTQKTYWAKNCVHFRLMKNSTLSGGRIEEDNVLESIP
jgi:hypothetical protein